jgi:hypothetical protein
MAKSAGSQKTQETLLMPTPIHKASSPLNICNKALAGTQGPKLGVD